MSYFVKLTKSRTNWEVEYASGYSQGSLLKHVRLWVWRLRYILFIRHIIISYLGIVEYSINLKGITFIITIPK